MSRVISSLVDINNGVVSNYMYQSEQVLSSCSAFGQATCDMRFSFPLCHSLYANTRQFVLKYSTIYVQHVVAFTSLHEVTLFLITTMCNAFEIREMPRVMKIRLSCPGLL